MGTPLDVDQSKRAAQRLVRRHGTTYAAESGIRLKDTPMPLFQLLVLCMLASKPISATIAMQAARELFNAGLRSPKAVLAADRRTMIEAFGRASYARYDESSADRLTEMAQRVRDEFSGDLRELARSSERDTDRAKRLLKQFKGIGDTGADMYLREIQDTWTWVRPYFDSRATAAAKMLQLPTSPAELGALAPRSNARLAAALVRVSLNANAA